MGSEVAALTPAEMQERLHQRYKSLAAQRASGLAVFGLEHGLSHSELASLDDIVMATSAARSHRDSCWLAWIAYSSEIGLSYDGLRYWERFAAGLMPGSRALLDFDGSDRDWIRAKFKRFAEKYRGAQSHGKWASHFGIIAGPVTNAIFPTDLQLHLAQALVTLNERIDVAQGAAMVGALIAQADQGGSSRWTMFKNDNQVLLGQFAIAVLQENATSHSPLSPEAVSRVLGRAIEVHGDHYEKLLERARRPRRLGSASRTRNTRKPQISLKLLPQSDDARPAEITAVELSLPDLSAESLSSDLGEMLQRARCVTEFSPGRKIPRGCLLAPNQTVTLSIWPAADTQLVTFETSTGSESAQGPCDWKFDRVPHLFHVREDEDVATQLEGGKAAGVLPGRHYILVRPAILASSYPLPLAGSPYANEIRELRPPVPDMQFIEIRVPDKVEPNFEEALAEAFGIPVHGKLSVVPVGVPPSEWDGQSSIVQLKNVPVLLGLQADHTVDLRVKTGQAEVRGRLSPSEIQVLQLDNSSPQQVVIEELRGDTVVEVRTIQVELRDPEPDDSLRLEGLRVWQMPSSESGRLESLLDGSLVIVAIGQANQTLRLILEVPDRLNGVAAACAVSATLPLEWEEIRPKLVGNDTVRAALDDVGRARLRCILGSSERSLSFQRDYHRLRWSFRRAGARYSITLQDDGDDPSAFEEVRLYPYESADRAQQWSCVTPNQEFAWVGAGGLLLAERNGLSAGIVLPPPDGPLAAIPSPRLVERSPGSAEALSGLLKLAAAWAVAECPISHPLPRGYRSDVLHLFARRAASMVCGPSWAAWEDLYLSSPLAARSDDWDRVWVGLRKAGEVGKGAPTPTDFCALGLEARVELFRQYVRTRDNWPKASLAAERRLRMKGHPRGIEHWLAEFCLRVSSDPRVAAWADDSLMDGVVLLLAQPYLLKLSRMIVLQSLLTAAPPIFPPQFDDWPWR